MTKVITIFSCANDVHKIVIIRWRIVGRIGHEGRKRDWTLGLHFSDATWPQSDAAKKKHGQHGQHSQHGQQPPSSQARPYTRQVNRFAIRTKIWRAGCRGPLIFAMDSNTKALARRPLKQMFSTRVAVVLSLLAACEGFGATSRGGLRRRFALCAELQKKAPTTVLPITDDASKVQRPRTLLAYASGSPEKSTRRTAAAV